ncbi:MAG: hypothetical protein KAY22_07425 [Rhizorhabdus sp.]|uniref:hypothetical protein n=1 Tax=Rhizorhabdus sp. TaxID=1968843 RepID=UPI001B6D59D7|nr:hypothetical protein [Rhizorhabdus sp.]MBP8232119.1 hypothetical protein [Rhizorhabdus sp.]
MAGELSETLKARVTQGTKTTFEELAAMRGVPVSDLVRGVLEHWAVENAGHLTDRVMVVMSRPLGWQEGAWKIRAKLKNPGEIAHWDRPISFEIPNIPKRIFIPDRELSAHYLTVMGSSPDNIIQLGQLINGEWAATVYSNGIEEGQNPSPKDVVRDRIRTAIEAVVDRLPRQSPVIGNAYV